MHTFRPTLLTKSHTLEERCFSSLIYPPAKKVTQKIYKRLLPNSWKFEHGKVRRFI